ARAVKLKIGGRMSKNADANPGRSEKLIALARKTYGDDMALYFDANGSYDVAHAIKWGRILEDHGCGFYEEPVPWQDFVGTKAVADGLDITVAGGEQDSSLETWQWFVDNDAFGLLQPDVMYNGGLLRALEVARIGAAKNIPCTLHSPKNGALAYAMLHFAAVCPSLGPYQEFRAMGVNEDKPYLHASPKVKDGKVSVPTEPGLGVAYDEDWLRSAQVLDLDF
ncbi:MAG: enolase C-terminal domain-like protein, partial [Bacteroidota bacterium]